VDSAERLLADDLCFGEGPRWHDGRLWFSDFYDHAIKAMDGDGNVEVVVQLDAPAQPSGLGWLPNGELLIVSMIDRTVLRHDGRELVVHADLSRIAGFHCNDMVVDAQGRAYVGSFGFDLDGEIGARGFIAVLRDHPRANIAFVTADGAVSVAADELDFPNGSVITPDGATLIVAETLGQRLTAFSIAADGTLEHRHLFADVTRRAPDGICLDAEGAVWFADAMKNECVRVAEGGAVLQVVTTDQPCYACMLGGDDGRSLFMLTASSASSAATSSRTGHVLVTQVHVPHAGLP
jgi:sugar lactone lactonase YvrE